MDFLEAEKATIERAIYFRVADLLSLDVDLLFYDTTSLHFEVDDEDQGVGPDDVVRGAEAAGAKHYAAPRKRGHEPRTGAGMRHRSWSGSRSPAMASQCVTGCSPATQWM
jgi:hypothetical protein